MNSGHNLRILDDSDIDTVWESIFFALWYAEMGRGCEEIIAAVERACSTSYRLTKVGFITISKKWYGLDQHRIDKVSHLARHLLPVLINHQVKFWIKSCKKSGKLGTRDISCRQLIKKTLNSVIKSYGLCYFLLEILPEEISKSLHIIYSKLHIEIGKYELKANLIIFLYQQIISFATNITLDARLLRIFDQYVIKKFIEEILPNESQLTQILISLRLYQAIDKYMLKNKVTGKCKALLTRWSSIIKDVHENCINGDYFPPTHLPRAETISLQSSYQIKKAKLDNEGQMKR